MRPASARATPGKNPNKQLLEETRKQYQKRLDLLKEEHNAYKDSVKERQARDNRLQQEEVKDLRDRILTMHYQSEEKETVYATIEDMVKNIETIIPNLIKEKQDMEANLCLEK